MAENEQRSFVLYYSDYDLIEQLDNNQKAALLDAVFSLGEKCDMPELDPLTKMAYTAISRGILENRKKWEETRRKRSEAGKKGGSHKKTEKEIEEVVNEEIEDVVEQQESESHQVPYQDVMRIYNSTCVSYPKCKTMSEARKKAIRARFNNGYTLDDFKELFEKAEKSSFLRGSNNNNWSANFDWLIKDANMAKVLDGNYDDKKNEVSYYDVEDDIEYPF